MRNFGSTWVLTCGNVLRRLDERLDADADDPDAVFDNTSRRRGCGCEPEYRRQGGEQSS
jgi:hypothetical protein